MRDACVALADVPELSVCGEHEPPLRGGACRAGGPARGRRALRGARSSRAPLRGARAWAPRGVRGGAEATIRGGGMRCAQTWGRCSCSAACNPDAAWQMKEGAARGWP